MAGEGSDDTQPDEPEPFRDEGDRFDREDAPLIIASGWRRLIGYVAESFVLGLVVLVYQVLTHSSPIEGAAGLVVPVLNGVVAVAVVGRTLGMAITGTRVIVASTTEPPGWTTAIIRWVVVIGPGLIPFAAHLAGVHLASDTWSTLSTVSLAWTIVVYLPIAYDRRRRGLHDRAAGTEVVLSRRRP